MTHEFLEAVKDSKDQDDSSERFRKLKKEQAGTEKNQAEKRYQELKEEAKKEFIEKQKQREKEREKEERRESDYVTY